MYGITKKPKGVPTSIIQKFWCCAFDCTSFWYLNFSKNFKWRKNVCRYVLKRSKYRWSGNKNNNFWMSKIFFLMHALNKVFLRSSYIFQEDQLYTPPTYNLVTKNNKNWKMVICNFCYIGPNISLLGYKWS